MGSEGGFGEDSGDDFGDDFAEEGLGMAVL